MPANVRLHIDRQGLLCQRKRLVGLSLAVENQRLHGHGVSMARVFLEDKIGRLQATFVLLVLKATNDGSELRRFFRRQWLRHRGGFVQVLEYVRFNRSVFCFDRRPDLSNSVEIDVAC